ncbi:ferredoxin [Sphaerisporangium dianthi]|uniref:Ferredoxin n=1 Tax=Sphaerisporangium dianthi TaxID=1436120 RepID=A0ABV9CPG4_9ACTN
MRVQLDPARCHGHGRCYDLAPEVFSEDGEGYGHVIAGGVVPPDQEHDARLAVANCPERAIDIVQES